MANVPNNTYIDQFINDGQQMTISMKNLYNTILITDADNEDHIFRVPLDDFFLRYKSDLDLIVQYYSLPQTMFYKPKMLSLEQYGTTELWLPILRVNGMKNITEFHNPIIKLYNPDSLKELIKIYFKREGKK